ncbi:MAG: hypothetical protein DRJ61_15030 [Acidobacteria bacterium]|nr:MAG: hypothetical protein DRJ61_15030 [Acidobacteriota bacterium]
MGHCSSLEIYPYLPRNVEVERVNQVWSTDITDRLPWENGKRAAPPDWVFWALSGVGVVVGFSVRGRVRRPIQRQ